MGSLSQQEEKVRFSSEFDTKIISSLQAKDQLIWRPWVEIENRVPVPIQNANAAQVIRTAAAHRCPILTCKEHMGFKRKPEFTRHFKTQHTNNTREECEHCRKVFTRKDNLTRHMKSAHDNKSKPECKFCNKRLSRRDAVSRHQVSCSENPKKSKITYNEGKQQLQQLERWSKKSESE